MHTQEKKSKSMHTLSQKMAKYRGVKKICSICQSKRSYGNPMAKCWECEKNFCFDHIVAGCVNKKMKQNDEVRDICEEDFDKYSYHAILD